MQELYKTVMERRRPEDIAQMILDKFGKTFSYFDCLVIEKAAKNSLSRGQFSYSSMANRYKKPIGAVKQLSKGLELFPSVGVCLDEVANQPEGIDQYASEAGITISKNLEGNNFLVDRLSKDERKAAGLDISKRQYNKRFRYLKRLKAKSNRLSREFKKHEFTLIGNTSLATKLSYEEFSSDVNTACFIAYYVSRCNLRSEFTISGQVKPYDEVADKLFAKCKSSKTTNWFVIAHVFPEQYVLENVSDHHKGMLLGQWYRILEDIAQLLSEVWSSSEINRETMIVKRGNDSSTWNNTASAWNKARDSWIALNYALGTEEVIDQVCFGKVLRLMAGDVAAWHLSSGAGLDDDTKVWLELPLPWEVFQGKAKCEKDKVKAVCERHDVDAVIKGWIAPRPNRKKVKYSPTPELVHGVTVSHPGLATLLKNAGYFSGKPKY